MRSGRPAYHIKARFVSFFDIHNRSMVYFELDNKGNLKKNDNGQFSSHIENSYANNNNMIMNPNANIITPRSDIPRNDVNSLIKENDNNVEKIPENNNEIGGEFDNNVFGSFDDGFDMFNSVPINDTDFFFPDDNLFSFSEDQPLNII